MTFLPVAWRAGAWPLAAALVAGCATGGTLVTEAQLATFRAGETSYDDMIRELGRPTTATAAPDGTRIAIYSYEHLQTRAATFVPVLGGFLGGTDVSASWAVCYFDSRGLLEACKLTASHTLDRPG